MSTTACIVTVGNHHHHHTHHSDNSSALIEVKACCAFHKTLFNLTLLQHFGYKAVAIVSCAYYNALLRNNSNFKTELFILYRRGLFEMNASSDFSSLVSSQFKFLNSNVDLKFSSKTWRDYYFSRTKVLSKVQARIEEEKEEMEENGYHSKQTIDRKKLNVNVRNFLKKQMLSQEVRYFILENMFIFAEIDYDDDCDSDSVPRDITTTAIMFSPVGFPRKIEVQMRAHFRNRVYSNEFSKTVRCSMI